MAESYVFSDTRKEMYEELLLYTQGLIYGEPDITANLANVSALINLALEDINWCGFYIMREGQLVLGPFQGKPACIRIKVGSGVCGTAVAEDKTQLVKNVHEFPGHIACDSASNSEIVLPIHNGDGTVFGVLDIDSPSLARFDEADRQGLEAVVKSLEGSLTFLG